MVTRWPWAFDRTAVILFVVVDEPGDPRWSVYTHFSPTAMGNSDEPAVSVLPEPLPPDPPDEAEVPGCEPPEPDPPELAGPHPATSSAAAARAPAIRPAK